MCKEGRANEGPKKRENSERSETRVEFTFPCEEDITAKEKRANHAGVTLPLATCKGGPSDLSQSVRLSSVAVPAHLKNLKRLFHSTHFGIICYFIWYLLFSYLHPSPLVDEPVHQDVISSFQHGNFFSELPMLPGYHWLIATISHVPGPSLGLSRFLTCLISAAMIALYASIPQQQNGHSSKRSPLLLAFLPILFPYTSMVYTDAVALFFIIGAVYFRAKRLDIFAALSMLIACLIRQSNMVWLIFMMAWSALDAWDQCKRENVLSRLSLWNIFTRHLLPKIFSSLVVLSFMSALLLSRGAVLYSDVSQNRLQPNIGNFYILSFVALILWAPIWLERARDDLRAFFLKINTNPVQSSAIFLFFIALSSVLITTFDNWHPWNESTWFLHNIPLILMDKYISFRILGVISFFLTAWFVARFWSLQENRRHLLLLTFFTFLFLLPHPLVESRYLIVPFALASFFTNYTDAQTSKLTYWYFSISVVTCVIIASGHRML